MEQHVPIGGKPGPVAFQYAAELCAVVLGEHVPKRLAMVEEEDGLGADELLNEKRRRGDFS